MIRLGASAVILEGLGEEPFQVAARLRDAKIKGVVDIVPALESVGVYFDAAAFRVEDLEEALTQPAGPLPEPALHRVPVLYDGEDLGECAALLGIREQELIDIHTSEPMRCRCLGFCPGFPYLGPIPEPLRALPRRDSPRTAVPKGSVAIAAGQGGIYPEATPGGWNLLGRTPCCIVDAESDFFPIMPGDWVQFEPITPSEFDSLQGVRLA